MTMTNNRYVIKTVVALVVTVLTPLFVACCNDDESTERDNNFITFASPVTTGITRAVAGEIVNPYPKKESFKVYGRIYKDNYKGWNVTSITDDNFKAEGEVATYQEIYNGWVTSTKHRWQKDCNYAFAAFSPSDVPAKTVTYNDEGLTVENFVPEALGSQYDLLYSKRIYDINSSSMTSDAHYNGVPITFYHALSSIVIKIGVHPAYLQDKANEGTLVTEGQKFKLKHITLKNVQNKATFKQNIVENTAVKPVTYTENPTWTLPNTAQQKKNYAMISEFNAPYINIPVIADQTEVFKAVKPLTDIGGYSAILIPQSLEDVQLVIEWTATADDANPEWITTTIDLAKYGEWQMGYRYIYTIAFQEDRIYFAPNADQMNDNNGGVEIN